MTEYYLTITFKLFHHFSVWIIQQKMKDTTVSGSLFDSWVTVASVINFKPSFIFTLTNWRTLKWNRSSVLLSVKRPTKRSVCKRNSKKLKSFKLWKAMNFLLTIIFRIREFPFNFVSTWPTQTITSGLICGSSWGTPVSVKNCGQLLKKDKWPTVNLLLINKFS